MSASLSSNTSILSDIFPETAASTLGTSFRRIGVSEEIEKVEHISELSIDMQRIVLDNNLELAAIFAFEGFNRERILAKLFQIAGSDAAFKEHVTLLLSFAFHGGTNHEKVTKNLSTEKRAFAQALILKYRLAKRDSDTGSFGSDQLTLGRIAACFPEVMFMYHCRNPDNYNWVEAGEITDGFPHKAFRWPGAAAIIASVDIESYCKWAVLFDKKSRKNSDETDVARKERCLRFAQMVRTNSNVTQESGIFAETFDKLQRDR